MSKNQNGLCINMFRYPKLLGLLVNTYEYENFKKDASTGIASAFMKLY